MNTLGSDGAFEDGAASVGGYRQAAGATALVAVADDIRLAAAVRLPVLITGGSREERDLCARVIHATGHDDRGPFVTMVLQPGPPPAPLRQPWTTSGLLDSMLGRKYEHARGGTLFVDDVAEATPEIQADLLMLLEASVSPLLPGRSPAPGVRIIAGAGRHLDGERAAERFSSQLFYRLNVVHVDLARLGAAKETYMKVRDLMTTPPQTCRPDTDLAAVAKLMWDFDCGFIPVVDAAGMLAGVVTDRDICIASATRRRAPEHMAATEAMSAPVHACLADDALRDALDTMKRYRIRRLPVLDANGRLHGVISMNDVVAAAGRKGAPGAADVLSAVAAVCARRPAAISASAS